MTQTLEHYAHVYERASRAAGSRAPAWLTRARAGALERFLAQGFPTTRDEEWRFTSVAPVAAEAFELDGDASAADGVLSTGIRLEEHGTFEIVFVNGRHAPALSRPAPLPAGARVEPLTSALDSGVGLDEYLTRLAAIDRQPFTALNTAFLTDAAVVWIPPGTVVERPIHILFVSTGVEAGTPGMSHPRTVIVAGHGSQARVVETFAGPEGRRYFTNGVTEIAAGEGAVVEHYRRQHESLSSYHVGSVHVRLGRDANVSSHSLALGGALVRNDVMAVLDGAGAECTLDGLYLADGDRLVDNHTTIDHAQPHCNSRELYKGILAGKARGVFNGKVIVRPDAQKTDAKQTNRALLLSEDARINTKPQLEIFADDVKCTHGAAVGQIDDEAVFYLRSRGLSEAEARRLLVHAFAGEVLNRMPLGSVRAAAEAALLRQLGRLLPAAA